MKAWKGPENPKGIVSVAVKLWKQDKRGEWFPVFGEAYWDEFCPVEEEWAYDQQEGRRKPTGKKAASQTWAKMPIVMLTKCAEGQALRAGWPDQFGGLYAEEEVEAAKMREVNPQEDVTPSQKVEREAVHKRQNMLGNRAIMMTLDPSGSLQRIPVGEVADRCLEFIRENEPEAVYSWSIQNREPLREFWAESPNDALAVKAEIEKKTASVGAAA